MHTGEPLFSGTDQLDQMHKLVQILGPPPDSIIDAAEINARNQLFELQPSTALPKSKWRLKQRRRDTAQRNNTENDHLATIVGRNIGGPSGRRKGEPGHSEQNYDLFLDLIHRMLDYSPTTRIKPDEALRHPFLNDTIWASTHLIGTTDGPESQRRSQQSDSSFDQFARGTNKFPRQQGVPPQQKQPYAAALLGITFTDGSEFGRSHSAPTAALRRRAPSDASALTQVAMDVDTDDITLPQDTTVCGSEICDAGTQTSSLN
eukprot:CAMPEP_0197342264 /NCGR_PEP_ID=MMETSP0892-20130614/46773_1 /TAXON_ID=44058 ORGANISM="Aureoumbra lagunensis, Strain CCMP1510" /NCGR_SAMPLE_ID=MMETSP0892 /ASSEMBLY_ACC=CAM_ASM_000538 /LENGTH=260 /DNA_ID=CAMNT_0042847395 /DNA_START=1029 /DNA_END=1811 /DNA_ORIENTATION=+